MSRFAVAPVIFVFALACALISGRAARGADLFDDDGDTHPRRPDAAAIDPREGRDDAPAPEQDEDVDADAAPAPRQSIPDTQAQKTAEKLVKDVFAAEYAKTGADDRRALAAELVRQSDSDNDTASRYVLLREARDIAVGAGDFATAAQAIDAMADSFDGIDAVDMKLAALLQSSKAANGPGAEQCVEVLMDLSDEALEREDIEAAAKVMKQGEALLRKAKHPKLTADLHNRSKELRDIQTRYRDLGAQRQKLATTPDDPAANLTVGQFRCFVAGNWAEGLPLLAKGSDEALKSLAGADLSEPDEPTGQLDVADKWWALAEKQSALSKALVRDRAVQWYQRALPELDGLKRTAIEKRIAQAESTDTSKKGGPKFPAGGGGASNNDDGAGDNGGMGRGEAGDPAPLLHLLRIIPRDLLPSPGQRAPKIGPLETWATRNIKGKPTEFPVVEILQIDIQRYHGVDLPKKAYVSTWVHGHEINGQRYDLHIWADVRDAASLKLIDSLAVGDRVRLRGRVDDFDVHSEGHGEISFNLQLESATVGIARQQKRAAPPRQGANAGAKRGGKKDALKPDDVRTAQDVVTLLPENLRPPAGEPWPHDAHEAARRWTEQNAKGLVLHVNNRYGGISGRDRDGNGTVYATLQLGGNAEQFEVDGVSMMPFYFVRVDDEAAIDRLFKLTRQDEIRFRAKIESFQLADTNQMNNPRSPRIHIHVHMRDPVFEVPKIGPAQPARRGG